jgi:uncharacterized repeat protein (TIGR01451 family)
MAADKASEMLPLNDLDGSDSLTPGDRLTYTIVVDNQGPTGALNVVLEDTPDVNTSLVVGSVTTSQGSVTLGNTVGDTRLLVNIGSMPSSSTATITFEVQINDPLPDEVTQIINQGNVGGDNFSSVLTNDPSTDASGDPTIDTIARQAAIPTLSQGSTMLFLLLLAAVAVYLLRR